MSVASPGKSYVMRGEEEGGSGTQQIGVPWRQPQQPSAETQGKEQTRKNPTACVCAAPRCTPARSVSGGPLAVMLGVG